MAVSARRGESTGMDDAEKGGGAGVPSARQRLDYQGGEHKGGDSAGAVREETAVPFSTPTPGKY